MRRQPYKQVKLCVYNYGTITEVADFKHGFMDACKVMRWYNAETIAAHRLGKLPESTFYFVSYLFETCKVTQYYVGVKVDDYLDPYYLHIDKIIAHNENNKNLQAHHKG